MTQAEIDQIYRDVDKQAIAFLDWFATKTEYIDLNTGGEFPMWQTHRIHEDQMQRNKMGIPVDYTAKTSEDIYQEFLLGKNPKQEDMEQRVRDFYDKDWKTNKLPGDIK